MTRFFSRLWYCKVTAKHDWHPIHESGDIGRECRLCGERVFDKRDGPGFTPEELGSTLGGGSS